MWKNYHRPAASAHRPADAGMPGSGPPETTVSANTEYTSMTDRELIALFSLEEAMEIWHFHASIFPQSEEGIEYLASLSPAFFEFIGRDTALDPLASYGPERITQLYSDTENNIYALFLYMLTDYLCPETNLDFPESFQK